MSGQSKSLWLMVVVVVAALTATTQAKRLHGKCDFEAEGERCGLEGSNQFVITFDRPAFNFEAMNSGYSGSGYLLLEKYNDEVRIGTPTLVHGEGSTEARFAYYLNGQGDGISSLSLMLEVEGEAEVVVWVASTDDRSWHFVNLNLDVPTGASFKVTWVGLAHRDSWLSQNSWLGLDYIEVVDNGGAENCFRPPPVLGASPWSCSSAQAPANNPLARPMPREELADGTVCNTACKTGFAAQGIPTLTCNDGIWVEAGSVVFICLDTEGPQFDSCPTDQEVLTPYGWASLWYTVTQPGINDNSGTWNLELFFNEALQDTNTFTIDLTPGTYNVRYVASDLFNNKNTCAYNVIVQSADITPPSVVSCPISQTIESDSPLVVAWSDPIFTDDTGYVDRVESSHETGSLMGWGRQEVLYTAYDNSSNAATCFFTVTVFGLPCSPLEIPQQGSLVCHDNYGGRFCVTMCGNGMDFHVPSNDLNVPKDYLCSTSGSWFPYDFTYDCLASQTEGGPSLPSVYYYPGLCNETEAQSSMKQQALTIFNTVESDITLGQVLKAEDFYVSCGGL
ncbi:hypothetical protein Pmani_013574 [Petrolisthes manimaculis]|uniref:HYR domain-containing protein n=1 Tax=Petrolisthes manimaculis TaxID=1843537 RepID=A0AAE1PY31_9EUCA|nr:hypothetical protein Pmani_013574 [Petrolisthes manimaculis]